MLTLGVNFVFVGINDLRLWVVRNRFGEHFKRGAVEAIVVIEPTKILGSDFLQGTVLSGRDPTVFTPDYRDALIMLVISCKPIKVVGDLSGG